MIVKLQTVGEREVGWEEASSRSRGLHPVGLSSRKQEELHLGSCLGVIWIKRRIQRQAMRNELMGPCLNFGAKLFRIPLPKSFPFRSVSRGPETLRVSHQKSWNLDGWFSLSMIEDNSSYYQQVIMLLPYSFTVSLSPNQGDYQKTI